MRRDKLEAAELSGPVTLPAAPAKVIEALAPLLSDERIARIDAVVAQRTRAVVPVLDAVDDPRNVSAVLRSADAFGAQEVHLLRGTQPFLASRLVTQGADRWLDLIWHTSAEACVAALRERGFRVYVASMDGTIGPDRLAAIDRVAVVFGNENRGVSPELCALADGSYTIPMRGFSQSLNVSVAAAITLHAATRARSSELSERERQELRARFMLLSVPRGAQVLAERLERLRT